MRERRKGESKSIEEPGRDLLSDEVGRGRWKDWNTYSPEKHLVHEGWSSIFGKQLYTILLLLLLNVI